MRVIDSIIETYQEDFLIADGFDDAIIGVEESSMKLVYSVSKCVSILCTYMNESDAIEYFEFNVKGSYVGEKTPILC